MVLLRQVLGQWIGKVLGPGRSRIDLSANKKRWGIVGNGNTARYRGDDKVKMIIGGQKKDSSDGKTIEIFNPATKELIDTVPSATIEDIDSALAIAQEGKKVWKNTPLSERGEILIKYAAALEEKKKELATLLSIETGKVIRETTAEVDVAISVFKGYVEKANHFYGITMPDQQPGRERDVIFTRREPLGIIACIIPFNYPIDIFGHVVAPALAAGNAVIVKPSSDNPLTLIKAVELLLECGVPGSVAQILPGKGSVVGNWLSSSPKIDAVCFTGSTESGISTATNTAKNLLPSFLELGGNDALIVLEDADIEWAVKETVRGRVRNAGQTCCAGKRILVQNSIKEVFTEKLIPAIEKIKVGNPLDWENDMGCLINEAAAIEIEGMVKKTIMQGAKCILGGNRYDGTFFPPTLLVDVTKDMDIADDLEVFGPVFPIIGFDSMEEAVEIANQSQYGLSGGVITRDLGKAMKVAAAMECGAVVINGSGNFRSPEMAFGGYKMSGMGREGVSCTLDEMTQVKTIVLKNVL